jgi:hypothetical protein
LLSGNKLEFEMIFKDSHYVPILRWKRAERVSLRSLAPRVHDQITPLLELVPTVDNTPLKVAMDIRNNWGFSPFFLDLVNLPALEKDDVVSTMSDALRTAGVRAIPVIGLDGEANYQTAISKIVASDRRGACVRLYPHDLMSPTLLADLDKLLARLNLSAAQVDLIADYQLVSEFALPYAELCRRLPHLARWRNFVAASGAFSKDLTEYEKNAQYTRSREDWLFWQSQVARKPTRRPVYSDYSIQYAFYKEPPDRANVSASIRYTAEDYWVIMRGEGLFNDGSPGNAQYSAHAQLLCEREEFCGRDFSAGDRYIDNLNLGVDGPGNPETLLRAGINHHVTLVTDQLSKSRGTSIGDAPFLGRYPNQQLPRVERRLSREAYNEAVRLRQTRPTK